ncbi:ABC transporter permease [Fodinibius sediminis]|uniref:Putative ABC transport system permease protein n=1 Tax=Fodinibius sediminis TaxID=1214077 RepID=A0A521B8D5_9BACT|nr:FtsX-like permease family protein [Fodinibius sediminis]SMO43348.1 putative ABC transport system permease protein [Fodinibius sediminis]
MSSFFSSWSWKMAWRDARSNKKRLFVYISAIIIGVAAQVAITSFRDSLNHTINNQSKELLGADLEIETEQPFPDTLQAYANALGGEQAFITEFPSMILFPSNGATRLSNIRALEGAFPFYGTLETEPVSAAEQFKTDRSALVDQTLLTQFDLGVGDSVKVGEVTFPIGGAITKVPGEAAAAAMVGPRVFIPRAMLDSTKLVQRGSRVEYKRYFKFQQDRDMAPIEAKLDSLEDELGIDIDYETVEERREEIGEAVGNLGKFLNLVGFIALLLGGIGVASSIHVYINQKISTASVLRCFGASSDQTMSIFLIQAVVLGFLGALTGTILGLGIQYLLPNLVSDFLPVQVELTVSWLAIALGLFTGTGVALVFALLPLLALRQASPLYALRTIEESITSLLSHKVKFLIYAVVAFTIFGYATLLTDSWKVGGLFTLGMIAAFGLLLIVARLLMKVVKRYFPDHWPYVWRQGLANLYRPNNQTATLMLSLGLGMLLVSTLYFSQDMLMEELDFATREEAPNLIFFDIQPDQNEGLNQLLDEEGLPLLQNVPMVTMRLDSLRGRSSRAISEDTTSKVRGWALQREYRSTYRDSLVSSETLVEGEWTGKADPARGAVPVSAAREIAEDLNLEIGDSLTFDVQGVSVQAYVGSIREVDFRRVQPNFFMLFPTGVLEQAPQIYVTVTRAPSQQVSAEMQKAVVQAYPNISAIDVSRILETINQFIDKISFAIQFMALFSILTGLIVLASSVATSHFQRVRESVLLRTMGASKKQIIQILSVEYLFLGLLSALTGLTLSVTASWLLGYFYFDLVFVPSFWVIIVGTMLITGLTILIGMINSRSIYNKTPLEVLRAETT